MPTAQDLVLSLDKDVYEAGETMTLTVTTAKDARDVFVNETATVHVSLPGLGLEGDVTGQVHRNTGTWAQIEATDPARVWTLLSDDGNEAKYTATA